MSRRHPQPKQKPQPERVTPEAVQSLIDSGQQKRAVETAKELLRESPGPNAEAVLAGAFVARILSFDPHMIVEADSLYRLALERCPSARARLGAAGPRIGVRFGRLDETLRPLADEDSPSEVRAAIEDAVRRELVDPRPLAACTALPGSHPLRAAASEIAAAFEAVTSGPVADEQLGLPHVSRRSPLAPWKPLVRAIVCFHRFEDEACRAHLAAVDRESSAARLVPVIEELLAGKTHGSQAALAERIRGGGGALRARLQELDSAFGRHQLSEILRTIRDAVQECRRSRPDLLERLRQRVSARALLADAPAERVRAAMGAPATRGAAFHRLLAHVRERQGVPAMAAIEWAHFLSASVREGAFAANGPQAAAVLSHVLDLVTSLPEDHLEGERREAERLARSAGEPPPEADSLAPAALFERLAAISPRSEVFERWFDWTRRNRGEREAETVALRWRVALPDEARPLLLMMEMCERRGAHKKALGLLAQAERAEKLDPEVARARFRLTCALALKHLGAGQTHLLQQDVAALESHPESRAGRRAAFLAALRLFADGGQRQPVQDSLLESVARPIGTGAQQPLARGGSWREVSSLMGGEREASFLVSLIARAVSRPASDSLPPGTPAEQAAALSAACRLCTDLRILVRLPAAWERPLLVGLGAALDDGALLALGGGAHQSGLEQLAYAAAGTGLARRTSLGQFLWLRAQSLAGAPRRRDDCWRAAMAVAQRSRDAALLAAVRAGSGALDRSGASVLSPDEVERIVERELGSTEYPPRDIAAPPGAGLCDCPRCRAERAGLELLEADDDGDEADRFDDDPLADEDDDGDLPFPGPLPRDLSRLPPQILGLILEMISKHGEIDPGELARRDPALHRRLERAIDEYVTRGGALPGMGRRKRKPKRRR